MQMISTGVVLRSVSGRALSPAPKIDCTSDRKTGNTLKRVEEWLVLNAVVEAEAKRDSFNGRMFGAMKPGKLSQSDRDHLNIYLFGEL